MIESEFSLYLDAQRVSPYALSAFVALTEKGIPFDVHEVDLVAREQLDAPYQARSLTWRVA